MIVITVSFNFHLLACEINTINDTNFKSKLLRYLTQTENNIVLCIHINTVIVTH